jgi:hypothetical protein
VELVDANKVIVAQAPFATGFISSKTLLVVGG